MVENVAKVYNLVSSCLHIKFNVKICKYLNMRIGALLIVFSNSPQGKLCSLKVQAEFLQRRLYDLKWGIQ